MEWVSTTRTGYNIVKITLTAAVIGMDSKSKLDIIVRKNNSIFNCVY